MLANQDDGSAATHFDFVPRDQRADFVAYVLALSADRTALLRDWDAFAVACEAEIVGSTPYEIVTTYEAPALKRLRVLVEEALLAGLPSWQ